MSRAKDLGTSNRLCNLGSQDKGEEVADPHSGQLNSVEFAHMRACFRGLLAKERLAMP